MSSPSISQNPLGYMGIDFNDQPEFILANRAPTINDIYLPGTRWQDSSVSPPINYETSGSGLWNIGDNAYATSTTPGIVTLSLNIAADAPSNTLVPTVSATKTYVDAVASFGAPIATEVTQGIGFVASDVQAVARTANVPGVSAHFLTPTNLNPIFASIGAPIGSVVAGAGTFTNLTADGTGAVSLSSNAAGNFTVTAGDLSLLATTNSVVINGAEAVDDAIQLTSVAGGLAASFGKSIVMTTTEANADSFQLVSAGGIDVTATGAAGKDIDIVNTNGSINLTAGEVAADSMVLTNKGIQINTTGAAGRDIVLSNTGGSIHLTATEAVADAINIDSSGGFDLDAAGEINLTSSQAAATAISLVTSNAAGGLTITAGTGGILPSTTGKFTVISTDNAAQAIELRANGGVTETIRLRAAQGTSTTSLDLLSNAGGITLNAGLAAANSIVLEANSAGGGGIDVDVGTAGMTIDTTGALSFDSVAASNLTVTGAAADLTLSSVGGSVNISATEAAADAIVIEASAATGGVQIKAGTGGILIGDEADTTPIDLGNIAPTASRTITVGGGTVITAAVTDTINVGPGGATTNANSIKTVNVNTGGVTLGQVLTNIATGNVTSGTHTTSIATGNRAAGTMAVNLLTGTGTKTLGIGNADGLTTSSILGPVNINVNQNNDVAINTGTSTGKISIGNTAAGAIVINSASTISIGDASAGDITADTAAGISLDGATASNFTVSGAAQDLTLSSAGGSVNITATEAAADAIVLTASNAAGGIDITTGGGSVDISSAGFVTMVPATDTQASPSDTSVLNVNVGSATFTGFTTAAAASQTFIITNGIVTVNSVMFVNVCNEGANDAQLTITRVKRSAGAFEVTVKNNGAAALNGNVTVSFWVIKA